MGSINSGRPGGNPDIAKYAFRQKYDWNEPCSEQVSFRIPPSMKLAIKAGKIVDWAEVCRRALAEELAKP